MACHEGLRCPFQVKKWLGDLEVNPIRTTSRNVKLARAVVLFPTTIGYPQFVKLLLQTQTPSAVGNSQFPAAQGNAFY